MNYTSQMISTVQERLASLGWYTGKIDGESGPLTENATARFKAAHGLKERPYPGPLTMTTLWSEKAKALPPPAAEEGVPVWLVEARRYLGTTEVPGPSNNPVIMRMAENLDMAYSGDDVPWCGLFVAACMAVGAPHEPQNFNRLGARQWLQYGTSCGEYAGAIAVFWRTHPTDSWHGHVGFVTGVNNTHLRILGGNQSDAVNERWMSRNRLLGLRGPRFWNGSPAPFARTGTLSKKES